jgi:hypothetical protein
MVLMGYSVARGTLIYERNLTAKISCQTPFKGSLTRDFPLRVFVMNQSPLSIQFRYVQIFAKMQGDIRK